jgi:hypothetical protein
MNIFFVFNNLSLINFIDCIGIDSSTQWFAHRNGLTMIYEGVHAGEGAGTTGTQIASASLDLLLHRLPAEVVEGEQVVLLAVLLGDGEDCPVHAGPSSTLYMQIRVVKLSAAALTAWGRDAGRLLQLAWEGTALEMLQAKLTKIVSAH